MSEKYPIAIIEDDAETLKYLAAKINLMENFVCTAKCRSAKDFFLLPNNQFQFILLDLGLPDVKKGLDAIVLIKEKLPEAEIIILTSFEEEALIVQALSLGATGYLFKSEALTILEEELDVLLDGGAALSPIVARKIISHFNQKSKVYKSMTLREHQILKLLANGSTYEEIGEALEMKIDNIRYYIKTIYKKLHVDNRSAAVQKYFFNIK